MKAMANDERAGWIKKQGWYKNTFGISVIETLPCRFLQHSPPHPSHHSDSHASFVLPLSIWMFFFGIRRVVIAINAVNKERIIQVDKRMRELQAETSKRFEHFAMLVYITVCKCADGYMTNIMLQHSTNCCSVYFCSKKNTNNHTHMLYIWIETFVLSHPILHLCSSAITIQFLCTRDR